MTESKRINELQLHWTDLLQQIEAQFDICTKLDVASAVKPNEKAEATRKWWAIANSALWMFVRTRAQYDYELTPFPYLLLGRLANISEELSMGNVPSFVSNTKTKGRAYWRMERHHIAYAVLYIEAVKRGEINDHSPNKTVRRAYNVTARAVQKWLKRKAEICVGVPHRGLSSEQLTQKMIECGKVYSRIGRGAPGNN